MEQREEESFNRRGLRNQIRTTILRVVSDEVSTRQVSPGRGIKGSPIL